MRRCALLNWGFESSSDGAGYTEGREAAFIKFDPPFTPRWTCRVIIVSKVVSEVWLQLGSTSVKVGDHPHKFMCQ